MAEIYLLRHAESVMNIQPHLIGGRSNWAPLSEHGRVQAKQFGLYMRRSGLLPSIVYSSPAVRTLQTIGQALIQSGIDVTPVIDDRLQELAQGKFEGLDRTVVYTPELVDAIRDQQKAFKLDGGESIDDVSTRMYEWLNTAAEAHPYSVILAGTHGFAIRSLVGKLRGWSHAEVLDARTSNVSLTYISGKSGTFTVHSVGEKVIAA